MTKVNMNQVEALELNDDQLDAVVGGKGRGGSIVRDIYELIKRMLEKNKPQPSNG